MSSTILIKRKLTGGAAAGGDHPVNSTGKIGELAVNAADPSATPRLFFQTGDPAAAGAAPTARGWIQVNPPPRFQLLDWSNKGVGQPGAANNIGLAYTAWNTLDPAVNVLNGEVVIATYKDATWMLIAPSAPGVAASWKKLNPAPRFQALDWSSKATGQPGAAGSIGQAYTAWNNANANNVVDAEIVIANYQGSSYILIDPAQPATDASWKGVGRKFDPDPAFYDLDALAPTAPNGYANPALAYAAWHAQDTTNNVFDGNLVFVGFTPDGVAGPNPKTRGLYMLGDLNNPAAAAEYTLISTAPQMAKYRGNVNVEGVFNTPPFDPVLTQGDWFTVQASTVANRTKPIVSATWGANTMGVAAGEELNVGDMLMYDGTEFHLIAQKLDLAAYLPLVGGQMTDGAGIVFDTTTARTKPTPGTAPGANTVKIIEGDMGLIDAVEIDGGTF
jgi:hypothetical protein